jgi:hypothetical protein
MKIGRIVAAALAAGAFGGLAGASLAAEVNAHIEWDAIPINPPQGSPVGESFSFNTADGVIDGDYLVFQTIGDTLGQTAVFFGDSNVTGEYGTGTYDSGDVNPTYRIDYFTGGDINVQGVGETCCAASPMFDGSTTVLGASPDTSYASYDGSEFSFSLAPAPEPAAWALMIVGVGAMGAALRARRRSVHAT